MTPPIDRRQSDDWSCGAVAAAVALDLCGLAAAEVAAVQRAMPATALDGTDPRTLESVIRRAGLKVQAGEMDHADLIHHVTKGRPVLCLVRHGDDGHWVTVYAASPRAVYLHCPQEGRRRVTAAAFRRDWWDADRSGVRYERFGLAVH